MASAFDLDALHYEDPHAPATDGPWMEAMQRGLRMLSADCRKLLIRYYYQNRSFEDLTQEFNYGNEQTSRVRKSQCLARLRDICRKSLS